MNEKIELLGYEVVNSEKFNRAIYGTMARGGNLQGGVGEQATDLQKLAEYDRLGGFIRKDKAKVKTGSFYDFKQRKMRETAEVVLLFRDLEGTEIEVPDGEPIPMEVKAAEIAQEKKAEKAKTKKRKTDEE